MPTVIPGRLALRVEGDNWNAYFAKHNTMEGAIFMGSIPMAFVVDRPERKEQFMRLMKDCFDDFIEEQTGVRSKWDEPIAAPESERTGNA